MTQSPVAACVAPAVTDVTARPGPAPSGAAPAVRLAWLDALRGLAALVVVFYHLRNHALGGAFNLLDGWLSAGRYGVLLFFLVSGYVIPMSLQRYGSLRTFWVGRIFRIYPAWLLAAVAMAALIGLGLRRPPRHLVEDPATYLVGQATMLQELLGSPSFVYVYWTLSYEMVFYLLASALFVLGLHRRCAWWAVLLALGTLLGGRLLPGALFTGGDPAPRTVTAVLVAALAATVAAYLSGRRSVSLVVAVAGLGMVALPALNGAASAHNHASGSWQSLAFLTIMFAGTVIHAAQHGALRPLGAALSLGTVAGCLLAAAWWHTPAAGGSAAMVAAARGEAVGTLVAVAATFALGYALRHRRVPRPMAWLGQVSYSVYLLHPIVLYLLIRHLDRDPDRPVAAQLAIAAGYLAIVLLVSWASYLAVERPGQRLGRRVLRMLDRRLGPDRSGPPPARRASVPQPAPPLDRPATGQLRPRQAARSPRRVAGHPMASDGGGDPRRGQRWKRTMRM